MSSSRRRPELRLSISQGRDGSQYHRGGTPEKSPSSGKYFLLTSPFIEQIIFWKPRAPRRRRTRGDEDLSLRSRACIAATGVHKRLGISQPSKVNYHGWSSFDPTRPLMSVLPSTARLPARFTTSRATNFYYSFLFLPREKRRAIESVYAFARRGDDLADGDLGPDEAAREIARYREALDGCYAGRTDGHNSAPEISALAETVQRYKIPRRYFDDLILGLEMDLGGARYPTFEDLAVYCYRVAGAIGLISIEVFGYRNPATREYAVSLGTALQLVNILRDLQSDARRGR